LNNVLCITRHIPDKVLEPYNPYTDQQAAGGWICSTAERTLVEFIENLTGS